MNGLIEFLKACPEDTKVYLGSDSERVRSKGKSYANYTVAAVVHIGGKHGGKIFSKTTREPVYDSKLSQPRLRLMTEVYKVAEVYLELVDKINFPIEVHLDINPDEAFGSSCVVSEAIGYIRGTCNVIPLVKPKAWAASTVADRWKSG